MVVCTLCGANNPDGYEICTECGADLSEVTPVNAEGETVDPTDREGVERTVPLEDVIGPKWKTVVELEITPERLRWRRNAIILSVVPSIVLLLTMVLWRSDYSLEFMGEYPMWDETLSLFDAMSYEDWPMTLAFVITVIFGILGLLSPMYSLIAPLMLYITIVLGRTFDVAYGASATGAFATYTCDIWMFVFTGVLCIVLLVVCWLSARYMSRSLSPEGKAVDKSVGVFKLGFFYNIDRRWYRVALR